jgi:hypothetical protein
MRSKPRFKLIPRVPGPGDVVVCWEMTDGDHFYSPELRAYVTRGSVITLGRRYFWSGGLGAH